MPPTATATPLPATGEHLPDPFGSEQLITCADPATGLRAVIAVDSTALGPGLGGVRMRAYPSFWDGAFEAQRLARAMTWKNALAGLPYGGAKSVIIDDGDRSRRTERLVRFGELVARLGGAYLPGVDMGTTTADLALMASVGAPSTCASDDPSPWTALGVFHAVCAAAEHRLGSDGVTGVDVVVQGVGNVGAALARLLAEAGARVTVTDIDADRAARVAREVDGRAIPVDRALSEPTDVLAPCAAARVVTRAAIPHLGCRIVAGGANDTLEDDGCADELEAAGILYVPDFVANAGGVVHIHSLTAGWDDDRLHGALAGIGARVTSILDDARAAGTTPLAAAHAQARAIVTDARTRPADHDDHDDHHHRRSSDR
ncbi:Glu/Leu/Phe/Val dehydrogenase [Nocardioides sp. ChNu-153]|uniref:Glu/Leu/Phe/Val dehydrogenase dimerization domain-containing protein n=1 Tax=unclassified Nocardioides TaxID=2615069 RepID=UPI00240727EE|nr:MULTISPECIES: Glu/Leu/Phe/Val dehydrogenase dimerization domain-containing protein [unclassified Nocardioides]MDF9714777.1 valine dehydrogenase [Nocardioides sp. ChNu-99]MDN7120097.1 Glu/Leu/Phe/Val dehydrogenase [Nocardioides sp. ChNu-153]